MFTLANIWLGTRHVNATKALMIFFLRTMLLNSSLLFASLVSVNATAAPLLHCHLQQGDTVIDTQAAPTTEPYSVTSLRMNHFRFKAVVVGDASRVNYVKLYTYYETGNGVDGDVRLLQEAKYLAPALQSATGPSSLTGIVYLYEPRLGREFIYDCALREEGA